MPGRHATPAATGTGRRGFLASIAATGVASLAGCLGGDSGGGDGEDDGDADPVPDELDLGNRSLDPGFPLRVYEPNTDQLVTEYQYHQGGSHWHFQPLEIPLQESRSMEVRVFDQDLNRIPLGQDEDFYVAVRPGEETPSELVDIDVSGDLVTMTGSASGTGTVVFELYRSEDDELVWTPKSITVTVG